jgi:hypothetical protein
MASVTFNVGFNESSQRFRLEKSGYASKLNSGLHAYQWTVLKPTGEKRSLCGITETIATRLSQYISEFNRPLDENSSELHRLVCDHTNVVSVQVFGPYDEDQDAKELEADFISRVPENERLNRTSGGNGGGAWSQYDSLPPSQGTFNLSDTPVKYYRFTNMGTHIAPQFTPSVRGVSGDYVIKRIGDDEDLEMRYIGHSVNIVRRMRQHASFASHNPRLEVDRRISEHPDRFVFGVLPSTLTASPRTRRKAEIAFIDKLKCDSSKICLNKNHGGGGPTKLRRRRSLFSEKPQ